MYSEVTRRSPRRVRLLIRPPRDQVFLVHAGTTELAVRVGWLLAGGWQCGGVHVRGHQPHPKPTVVQRSQLRRSAPGSRAPTTTRSGDTTSGAICQSRRQIQPLAAMLTPGTVRSDSVLYADRLISRPQSTNRLRDEITACGQGWGSTRRVQGSAAQRRGRRRAVQHWEGDGLVDKRMTRSGSRGGTRVGGWLGRGWARRAAGLARPGVCRTVVNGTGAVAAAGLSL